MPFRRQAQVAVTNRGQEVGLHQLDLLVEDQVVVELKAVGAVERAHFAVVRSYLRSLGLRDGLILNFGVSPLVVKRVSVGRSVDQPVGAGPAGR